MAGRAWLRGGVGAIAVLALADTAAWYAAEAALRRGVLHWAAEQRAQGVEIAFHDAVSSGWPVAARLRLPDVTLGPGGLPAAAVIRTEVTLALSPLQGAVLHGTIAETQVTAPGIAPLNLSAASWRVDVPLATPDRGTMVAEQPVLHWSGHTVTAERLIARQEPDGDGPRLSVSVAGLDAGWIGSRLPEPYGRIAAFDMAGVLRGGLPQPAATTEASLAAWRDGGGGVADLHARLLWGALQATASGQAGLDAALAPQATGEIQAHGLPEALDVLGRAGVVPPRAGQAARGVLGLLGDPDQVTLPLTWQHGTVSLGSFPLLRLGPGTPQG